MFLPGLNFRGAVSRKLLPSPTSFEHRIKDEFALFKNLPQLFSAPVLHFDLRSEKQKPCNLFVDSFSFFLPIFPNVQMTGMNKND